jgi:hypothetical protein
MENFGFPWPDNLTYVDNTLPIFVDIIPEKKNIHIL